MKVKDIYDMSQMTFKVNDRLICRSVEGELGLYMCRCVITCYTD